MTNCPNPSLVPVSTSQITKLALLTLKGLERETSRLRERYVEHILINVRHSGKRFWHKDIPFTRPEAEERADKHLQTCGPFYSTSLAYEFRDIRERRATCNHVLNAVKHIAQEADIWVSLETLSMLSRYE